MKKKTIILMTATLLGLAACNDARESLGLVNTPPDEFAVVDHPPLSMPPDFNLRPPRPGAVSPLATNPSGDAAKALYGDSKMEIVPQQGVNAIQIQNLSPAEQALIGQSGSDKADPHIRSALERDASQHQVVGNRKLLQALTFWKDTPKVEQGTVIDPVAERERLNKAKEQGAPVTNGATPALDKDKSVAVD